MDRSGYEQLDRIEEMLSQLLDIAENKTKETEDEETEYEDELNL